jgi:hypothetical protein
MFLIQLVRHCHLDQHRLVILSMADIFCRAKHEVITS